MFEAVIIRKSYFSKTKGHSIHSVEVAIPGNISEKTISGGQEWRTLAVCALNAVGVDVDLTSFHDKWNEGKFFVLMLKVYRKKDL